jgi:hypothetical protein
MTLVIKDRVLETCTSPGTGSVTLLGAATGYQTFNAAIGNGNTCYYTIADQNGNNWEVGIGTFTAPATLARTTVLASSTGSLVNFSSGTQNVFETYPAGKAVTTDTLAYPPAIGGTTPNTGSFTTLTASADSAFNSTGYLQLPKGTTGQQPGSPATGMIRYNTTNNVFEGYTGSSPSWNSLQGVTINNDTTSSTSYYPLFAEQTSGVTSNMYISNANYLFNPSNGELSALELYTKNNVIGHSQTITTAYTLPTNTTAITVGPVTLTGSGIVSVPSGSTSVWQIVFF